jgi:hypothetical protein
MVSSIDSHGSMKSSHSTVILTAIVTVATLFFGFNSACQVYHVSPQGNDLTGDGSSTKPWKTIRFAASKVNAGEGQIIRIGVGTFIEEGPIEVPPGVSVEGAGMDRTFIKAVSSFFYHPPTPGYALDKFLIRLNSHRHTTGNQHIRGLTIDGDSKQLHGGIFISCRSRIIIENIKVQHTHFSGIWLNEVSDSHLKDVYLYNCSWGSEGYSSGALNIANLDNVELNRLDINEDKGYGIKALDLSGFNNLSHVEIHNSHVSVIPTGRWKKGLAPNISIELWKVNLTNCEIHDCYVDNTISIVNSDSIPPHGSQTVRVHHNVFDMETRAHGAGYGIELTVHDAEVDHNYIYGGKYGIANWGNPVKNWLIHHNIFYALQSPHPGDIIRSQSGGLHNVCIYNNTVEFAGDKTMNFVGLYGGESEKVDIKNNLIINSNSAYSYYPNELIHTENGASINNLVVLNNSINDLALGDKITFDAKTQQANLPDPSIIKSGARPGPYYFPASGSALIDAGVDVGLDYLGLKPDVGAYEFGSKALPNKPPRISLSIPGHSIPFKAGSKITIFVNASDQDGTIKMVELLSDSTKMGEISTMPYQLQHTVSPGNHFLSVRAIDNKDAVSVSEAVCIKGYDPK